MEAIATGTVELVLRQHPDSDARCRIRLLNVLHVPESIYNIVGWHRPEVEVVIDHQAPTHGRVLDRHSSKRVGQKDSPPNRSPRHADHNFQPRRAFHIDNPPTSKDYNCAISYSNPTKFNMANIAEQNIQSAINLVNSGVSLRKAARRHGLVYATLWGRINGATTYYKRNLSNRLLSVKEEKLLVDWVLNEEAAARAPTKLQLRRMAQAILV